MKYSKKELEKMLKDVDNQTREKKFDMSKFLVPFIVVANIFFTWKIIKLYELTGSEPSTLIISWFAFTTGELWLMASIKKTKVKKGGVDDGFDNE